MIGIGGKDILYLFFRWIFKSRWRTTAFYYLLNGPARLLFGLRVENGTSVPRDGAVIFASNHASHFDGFFMLLFIYRVRGYPYVRPVYWKGILEMPIVGPLLRAFGGFSISHDAADARQRTAETKAMLKALRRGVSVHIAPEGMRNDELGYFNEGVALISLASGCPVVPCSLCGVRGLFDELPFPDRLWGRVKLVFHPAIYPQPITNVSDSRTEAKRRLTQQIRAAIASAIDYPVAREGERRP